MQKLAHHSQFVIFIYIFCTLLEGLEESAARTEQTLVDVLLKNKEGGVGFLQTWSLLLTD